MLKAQLEFGWWSSYSVRPPSPGKAATALQIPTHSGQVFRIDAGRDSDLKPAPTTTKIVSSRSTIAALIWAFRWIMVLWMASAGRRSASRAVDYPHVTARHSGWMTRDLSLKAAQPRLRRPSVRMLVHSGTIRLDSASSNRNSGRSGWFNSRDIASGDGTFIIRGGRGGQLLPPRMRGGGGWGVGP
jgi:hypothetical protein